MGHNRKILNNQSISIEDGGTYTYDFDSVPNDPNGLKFVREFQSCLSSDREVTFRFKWGNSSSYASLPHTEDYVTCQANKTKGWILQSCGFPTKVRFEVVNNSGATANGTLDLSVWG